MKRTSRFILGLLLLFSLFFSNTQPAFACSGGDHDSVAESEIIVGGWITNWEVITDMPVHYTTPIKLQMQVDRVFKGDIANGSRFEFIDGDSLFNDKEIDWGGGGNGTCGAFNVNPKGKYAIIGAAKDKDGHYQTNIWITFYVGDQPPTTVYAKGIYSTITDLQRLIPSFLPTSGGENQSLSLPLLIVGSTLLLIGILIRQRANAKRGRGRTSVS